MNDLLQAIISALAPLTTLGSIIAAILAWIAKIRWSQEYSTAKEETIKSLKEQISSKEEQIKVKQEQINSKQEQIAVKESQIAKLEALDSVTIHTYFEKQKGIFEEIIEKSQDEIKQAKAELGKVERKLSQTVHESRGDKNTIEKLENEKNDLKTQIKTLEEDLKQEVQNRKQVETYIQELPTILGGKSFTNFGGAVSSLEGFSRAYLDECTEKSIPILVKYKLLAVAMTFSWSFIEKTIPMLLNEYPTARIELNLLFVDPDYLEKLNLSKEPVDWASISRKRIGEIEDFAKRVSVYQGRLSLSARMYQNLPHWHGWLINNNHLLLGRTDWNLSGSHPILTVGQNKYRYFDKDNTEGLERISLFQDWHTYYSYFSQSTKQIYPSNETSIQTVGF